MEEGKWVTIKGNKVFIKDGQTAEEAFNDFLKAANALNITANTPKEKDIKDLEVLINDNKPYIESPKWSFDKNNKTAFKDLGPYKEDDFQDLQNEEDWTITKWLTDHGFKYELKKGDYNWKTKGKVGRNWVNTDKGNIKTSKNRIILNIEW